MLLIDTYVATSNIEGSGLFARHPIIKGFPVWTYAPPHDLHITGGDIEELKMDGLADYILKYGTVEDEWGSMLIDGDNCKFMNHSENPNILFLDSIGVATRDIAAGEELTCDYRTITTKEHYNYLLNGPGKS